MQVPQPFDVTLLEFRILDLNTATGQEEEREREIFGKDLCDGIVSCAEEKWRCESWWWKRHGF
jgi:hypothetical protein